MKTLPLLIVLIFFGMLSKAQENCTDGILSADLKESILNCCIKDLKHNNTVVYTVNGQTYEIDAAAVNFNGAYYELNINWNSFKNKITELKDAEIENEKNTYEYYYKNYEKATTQRNAGIVLTIIGSGFVAAGSILIVNNFALFSSDNETTRKSNIGGALFLSGAASLGIGIPLWAVGGNKRRKHQADMEIMENQPNLSLRVSKNSFGLVLNF